jgi:uncharacterized protein YbjT (DUF2867 family)
MKYVITGGAGNISMPLAEALLAAGHHVTIIGRSAENLKPLTDKGAKAAVGSLEDGVFVTSTFKEADAVYLMIPPNFAATGWREYQNQVADIYVNALKENGIKYAVVLSSVGAHMGNGAGPVDGLSDLEKKLHELQDLNVKNLRPSYFFSNFYGMIPMIKGMNIMGSNFGGNGRKLVLTHTADIAAVAAEELLALKFTGQSFRYIASDERTPEDIANVLGNAVGKPDLPWVVFTDEQALGGMLQSGLPATISEGYTELGKALREGTAEEDYWKHRPASGSVKLEDFAKEFAAAYKA